VQVVFQVRPAAIELDSVVATAVPAELRRSQSRKLGKGRTVAVGIGYEQRAIKLTVAAATFREDSLANDHDQAIEARVAAYRECPRHHQQSGAGMVAHVEVAVYVGDERVGVGSQTACWITAGRCRGRGCAANAAPREGLVGAVCN